MLAIEQLQQAPHPAPGAIEAFLSSHEFPIVEGRCVTFVFRGPASDVELVHWIYGLESSQQFQRLHGTDLWFLTLDIPEGSRMEYKLAVGVGHGNKRLVRDALNDKLAHDPFGANSVVHGAGYQHPEWSLEHEDSRKGEVHTRAVYSEAFGGDRDINVYLPARFRPTRRYPLLVVHDGPEYVQFAALKNVLDNLIHRLEIAPMIVAMTAPHDRMNEYANDERHARFVVDEIIPALENEFPIVPMPAARGLMGASFGAIAALSTAWRRQDVFGKLLLQSGSFVFTDIGHHDRGPAFDRVVEFVNEFRHDPGRPADELFMSCGRYESMIYYNRSLVPLFQSAGMRVRFAESGDGHNWENWRDRLREGLSWLFPGPLWMVYE